MASVLPDPGTPFGAHVARRLREERVVWLTTAGADGTPQPNPVWFYWDGEYLFSRCKPSARRLQHIKQNPGVALNFNSGVDGNDVVVLTGRAERESGDVPAATKAAYLEKYRQEIPAIGMTPEQLEAQYSVTLKISVTKVRGF